VHRFISRDNDRFMQSAIEKGIRAMRKARASLPSDVPVA